MQDADNAAGCGGVLFSIVLVGSSIFLPVGMGILVTFIVGVAIFVSSLLSKGDKNFLTMLCGASLIQYGIMYLTTREMELDTLAGDGFGMAVCALIMLVAGGAALKDQGR
ncbi:hypothetical protein [Streptomyces zaomyceticus]|uniref:hypothetical protein n=1 Tax=Streptomyces zaomyceticus TaxID=68286 RepID=UPI00324BBE77